MKRSLVQQWTASSYWIDQTRDQISSTKSPVEVECAVHPAKGLTNAVLYHLFFDLTNPSRAVEEGADSRGPLDLTQCSSKPIMVLFSL